MYKTLSYYRMEMLDKKGNSSFLSEYVVVHDPKKIEGLHELFFIYHKIRNHSYPIQLFDNIYLFIQPLCPTLVPVRQLSFYINTPDVLFKMY